MADLISIAVRSLVEHVYRGGSLDSGFRVMSAIVEGTKAHQRIQKQYGEHDQKEVYLKMEIPHEDLLFVIDGRCDGLLVDDHGGITVDKIKSTAVAVESQNGRLRDESITNLPFPFPAFRDGQRKLAGSVYKAIDEQRKLYAKAPTGIGKTISTLYPTIKAIGAGKAQYLFYLTARTITRTAAEDAFSLMNAQGLRMTSVTLTAKDKICFQDTVDCRKESCIYANGYYDRINAAILDLLSHETLINRTMIEQYARKHTVCPFEFSLDVAYSADAVICDYNDVFDPRISLFAP